MSQKFRSCVSSWMIVFVPTGRQKIKYCRNINYNGHVGGKKSRIWKSWLYLSIRLQHLKELLVLSFPLMSPLTSGGVFVVFASMSWTWHQDAPDSGPGDPKNDFLNAFWADFVNIQPCCSRYKENLILSQAFLLLEGCCLQGLPAQSCFFLLRRNFLCFPWVLVTTSSTLPINPQTVPLTGWKMRKTEITLSFWSIFQV